MQAKTIFLIKNIKFKLEKGERIIKPTKPDERLTNISDKT